jgi:hypothetical protein
MAAVRCIRGIISRSHLTVVLSYAGLDIEALEVSTQSEEWLLEAQERMVNWEDNIKRWIPWSTIHVDRNGKIMAAIFAWRATVCILSPLLYTH